MEGHTQGHLKRNREDVLFRIPKTSYFRTRYREISMTVAHLSEIETKKTFILKEKRLDLLGRKFKMNASVAIQVLPKVNSDEEVIRIVDEVIAYIKSTGLNYFVGPCETSIEGDYDELMDIVKECQKIAVRAGAKSVSAYVKINYRPEGDVLTIEKKVTKHH